jgi:tetratricopeptide (TPR) repeat protein
MDCPKYPPSPGKQGETTRRDPRSEPKFFGFRNSIFEFGLAGLLSCVTLGCSQNSQTTLPRSAVPPNAKIVKAEDLPKRTPLAETSVAFGNLRLHAVLDGSVQGDGREEALDQARKFFDQALKTDSKCVDAYKGLAQVEQICGNFEGALDYYRKALACNPKAAPLWYELGVCQARHANWPAAVESLQQASNLEPNNHTYLKTLGFCLAKNGRFDDSVICFKRIMEEGQAHYNLARLLHHEKQDDLSRLHVQLAIQANPKLTVAQDLLAQLDGHASSSNTAAVAAASGPNVGIDIEDVAAEISETPGNAN